MRGPFQNRRTPTGSGRRRALPLAAVLVLGACGGTGTPPPADCPNDVPPACSQPGPSYAADVAPVLHRLCGDCHTAGGLSARYPLDTYDQVKAEEQHILGQINVCFMPPADQPQPTLQEREMIFAWIVCGFMNN